MKLVKTETDPMTGHTTLTYEHYHATFKICPEFIRDCHVQYGLDILNYVENAINTLIKARNFNGILNSFRVSCCIKRDAVTTNATKNSIEIYVIEELIPASKQSVGFSIDE